MPEELHLKSYKKAVRYIHRSCFPQQSPLPPGSHPVHPELQYLCLQFVPPPFDRLLTLLLSKHVSHWCFLFSDIWLPVKNQQKTPSKRTPLTGWMIYANHKRPLGSKVLTEATISTSQIPAVFSAWFLCSLWESVWGNRFLIPFRSFFSVREINFPMRQIGCQLTAGSPKPKSRIIPRITEMEDSAHHCIILFISPLSSLRFRYTHDRPDRLLLPIHSLCGLCFPAIYVPWDPWGRCHSQSPGFPIWYPDFSGQQTEGFVKSLPSTLRFQAITDKGFQMIHRGRLRISCGIPKYCHPQYFYCWFPTDSDGYMLFFPEMHRLLPKSSSNKSLRDPYSHRHEKLSHA